MTAATGFVARACCARAPGRKVIITPAASGRTDEPILREVPPPPREERLAVHEASHAVIAIAVGGTVTSATVDGQPHVEHCASLTGGDRRVMTMAGPLGEAVLHHRALYRPPDAELASWRIAARRCEVFGFCDDCRIALTLAASTQTLPDYIAGYRAAEERTLALLDKPNIRAAIREIAAQLMLHGSLDGLTIHHIAARHGVAPI